MDEEQTRIEFKTAKELVLKVLEGSQRARNDDKYLILRCLQAQGQDIECLSEELQEYSWCFNLSQLGSFLSFETLTRCRREIQNTDGLFLPSDPAVLVRRKIKEEHVRRYYNDSFTLNEFLRLSYGVKE